MKKSVSTPMRMTSVMLTLLLLFSMTVNLGMLTVSAKEGEAEKASVYTHEICPGEYVTRGTRLVNDLRTRPRKMTVYIDGTLAGNADKEFQMPCNAVLEKRGTNEFFVQRPDNYHLKRRQQGR